MKKAVVLGATGGMGSWLVHELTDRGIETVAFSRNPEKLKAMFRGNHRVSIVAGNAYEQNDLLSAVRGADVIFHSVSVPYPDWVQGHPKLMKNVLQAARQFGSKVVIVDNIYAYGRGNGAKITEDYPKNPHTKKGKIRLEIEQMAQDAHSEGVETLFAHFPDFYGENAGSTYLHVTLKAITENKSGLFIGKLDVPREYIYTPDGANALVTLAMKDSAYNQHWNIPGSGVITGGEIIEIAKEMTGYKKRIRSIGSRTLGLVGPFSRFMKEVKEMMYLTEEPVVLNGGKYERAIGPVPKTPYEEGIKQTISSLY